jgi:L-asparaginase II
VVLAADGRPEVLLGDTEAAVFPRSSNKLMQAAGLVDAGLDLSGPALAMAAASHSGEAFHLAKVDEVLSSAGLNRDSLQTPPDWPYGPAARDAAVRAGGEPSSIAMNCSGKHAAMLATCAGNGWPTENYLDPDHPVQQACLASIEALSGEHVPAVGVDGCGAPLAALTLRGLATAYSRAVTAAPDTAARRVADVMRQWPDYDGGTGRDVTRLMQGIPGLLAKDGAEGVYAGALPGGAAFALKIDDGAERARGPVVVAALRLLGIGAAVLDQLAEPVLLGGGRPVGVVRVVPGLLA